MMATPHPIFLLILALSTLGTGCGVGLAQGLDAKRIVGAWHAELPSPSGQGMDRVELLIAEEGTFTGHTDSVRGGLLEYCNGSYKIADDTMTLSAVVQGGPPAVNGSKVSWTLKRHGEELTGAVYRQWNNSTTPVTFSRSK